MKAHISKLDVSRRSFMRGAGGLTFAFALSGTLLGRAMDCCADARIGPAAADVRHRAVDIGVVRLGFFFEQ